MEDRDGYFSIDGNGAAKRFDALDLVHGLRSEIRFAAVRAHPQGNTFDYEE